MMTSTERFMAAVKHQEVDRMPTDLHNFQIGARVCNKYFDEFVFEPQDMAEAHIAMRREFGHDVLLVENGTASLAQALGCGISFRKEDPPVVTDAALRSIEEWERLIITRELLDQPLLKANLKTVEILRKKLGNEAVIMGRGDQGPFSLASQLLGMGELLMDLADGDYEEEIHHLLEISTQAGIICCTAMMEAGAHCTSIGDSTAGPDVISPDMYRRYGVPYEKKLIREVHKNGGLIALHICGNATAIIDDMMKTEADILELDQKTDLTKVWHKLKGHTAILGQISPVTLMNGTAEQVRKETEAMLQKVGGRQTSGVILGPGCALGGTTPYENIHAMLRLVQEV